MSKTSDQKLMNDKLEQFDLNKVIKKFEQQSIEELFSLADSIGKKTQHFELNDDQENLILQAVQLLAVQYLACKKSVDLINNPKSPESYDNMLKSGVCYMQSKTSFGILIYKIISENVLKNSEESKILLKSLKSFHSKHWNDDKDYLEQALRDGRYTPPSAENDFIPQKTTFKHSIRALFPETNGELPLAKSGSGCLLLIPQLFIGTLALDCFLNLFS